MHCAGRAAGVLWDCPAGVALLRHQVSGCSSTALPLRDEHERGFCRTHDLIAAPRLVFRWPDGAYALSRCVGAAALPSGLHAVCTGATGFTAVVAMPLETNAVSRDKSAAQHAKNASALVSAADGVQETCATRCSKPASAYRAHLLSGSVAQSSSGTNAATARDERCDPQHPGGAACEKC